MNKKEYKTFEDLEFLHSEGAIKAVEVFENGNHLSVIKIEEKGFEETFSVVAVNASEQPLFIGYMKTEKINELMLDLQK